MKQKFAKNPIIKTQLHFISTTKQRASDITCAQIFRSISNVRSERKEYQPSHTLLTLIQI